MGRYIHEIYERLSNSGGVIAYWLPHNPVLTPTSVFAWWVWYYHDVDKGEASAWCPTFITLPFDQAY